MGTQPVVASPVTTNSPNGEPSGDRRVVTVLFTDVSGFTAMSERLDPETVTRIINEFFDTLVEPIYRYGGVVDKYIGDAIMALFGAPVAHEDDPERAVWAAYHMQQAAQEFAANLAARTGIQLRIRVGVNTGLVVARTVGGKQKHAYTVMGDTVNLAQRMESSAEPGKILVTAETYRLAAQAFEFRPLEAVKVKGKNQPIQVYEVIGPKTKDRALSSGDHQRFVGRSSELQRLRSALDQVRTGTPQLVTVTGEAGVGKSRLVREFLISGQVPPHVLLHGRCISYNQDTPLALLQDLMLDWLGLTNVTPSALREALERRGHWLSEEDRQRVEALLSTLYSLSSSLEIQQLSPSQRRSMVFNAINGLLLGGLQDAPLVLNLEDLHWADDASLDWLNTFLNELACRDHRRKPVLIVCHYRASERIPNLDSTIDRTHLVLQPLSEEESIELIADLLRVTEPLHEWHNDLRRLVISLLERSEGNPLFLCEIVRSLIESGSLVKQREEWAVLGHQTLLLPTTVNGVIAARLDALEVALRQVLQLASVMGRTFTSRLLGSMSHGQDIEAPLFQLSKQGFLHRQGPESYSFSQALIQEVTYNSILIATRKDLHRRVGEVLEEAFQESATEQPQVLARHYSLGGIPSKAAIYFEKAGQAAVKNYANQEALAFYTQALEHLAQQEGASTEQHFRVHLGCAELEITVGRYSEASLRVETALELPLTAAQAAEARAICGRVLERKGEYHAALEQFALATSLLDPTRDAVLQARVLIEQGWLLHRLGDLPGGVEKCNQAANLLKSQNSPKDMALAQSIIGITLYRQGQFELAVEKQKLALELREHCQDLAGVASSLNNLGAIYLELGNFQQVLDCYSRSLKIYAKIGDLNRMAILQANTGELLRQQGDFTTAERFYRQALEINQKIGNAAGKGATLCIIGNLMSLQSRHEEALSLLTEGIGILEGCEAAEYLAECYLFRVDASLALGQTNLAHDFLQKAIAQSEATQDALHRAIAARYQAELCLCEQQAIVALDHATRAADDLERLGASLEHARALVCKSKALSALRDETTANSTLDQARAIFMRLGANWDLDHLPLTTPDRV